MGLGLFRQQNGGALEFIDSLGIFFESQQAHTEEQAGGSIVGLKSKRLMKSRNSFSVIAAQQSDDPEVVIDERMFDPLTEYIREGVFSRIKITGLQLMNSCRSLCWKCRRQSLLRDGPHSCREKYENQDSKRQSPWMMSAEPHQFVPQVTLGLPLQSRLLDCQVFRWRGQKKMELSSAEIV